MISHAFDAVPVLSVSRARAREVDTDLLVIPTFEQDGLEDVDGLSTATAQETRRALERGEVTGKLFEVFFTPAVDWGPRRIALVGAGTRESYSVPRARQVAAAGALAARARRIQHVAFLHRGALDPVAAAQAIAEGLILATFEPAAYKTADRPPPLTRVQIVVPDGATAVEARAERGRVLGACSNVARELANEPANRLTPRAMAEQAQQIVTASGVSVEVLDERRIAELKMGLLLGVAQGSIEPPRLVVMRHDPPGAPDGPVLGLVGKGVTFDAGGISIKPAEGMERMKDDMAGGAAVIGAMRAIGQLGAPMRVVGIVPCTENMPSGRAVRPGDVLESASGLTVEVINTDAEGRLILADSLWYARQLGATHLVDVATLTGACVVALGKTTTGLFGTPDAWVSCVRGVADMAGDRAWPMPVFDDYREQLKSEIADLTNTGGRPAGAVTAALFLKQFTGGLPWAHMDVAGTAWSDEERAYQPKGPSGVAVRTLAELAFTSDAW